MKLKSLCTAKEIISKRNNSQTGENICKRGDWHRTSPPNTHAVYAAPYKTKRNEETSSKQPDQKLGGISKQTFLCRRQQAH